MEELLSLKWNNHRSTFLHILGVLRDKQSYTDVTLACDGKFYSVHKLVLSTCSDYFCAMFEKTACKSPVIVLKDIKSNDLEALLDYMYLGEVNVRQSDLASLIKAAENLRIKGLAVPDDEPPSKKGSVGAPSRRDGGSGSPPAKRKRRDESEDGREDVRPSLGELHTPPPPSSRPKSPGIQRLSPSPLRTPQESHASEDRDNRPLSSPAETSSSHSQAQIPHQSSQQSSLQSAQQLGDQISQSMGNQFRGEETPFVKVEMTDDETDGANRDTYSISSENFKEEGDVGGELSNDLPEFLQQAASSALAGTSASYHQSFAGPSGFQPEVSSWHGDGQSLPGNFPGIGFPPTSQENPPGMSPRGDSQPHLQLSTSEVAIARALLNIPKQSPNFSPSAGASGSQHNTSPSFTSKVPTLLSFASVVKCHKVPTTTSTASSVSISPLASSAAALSGVKYSSCPECGKIFRGDYHKYNLKKHLTIHAGLRPYPCPVCHLAFNQKVSMKRHFASVHRNSEAVQPASH
ncbi:protein tramtrack, beta isoform-like isoform X7 [Macrobrachium nipponense]|uniref:protein tramtrack, beta isoform-like isoform X7 n=1 Tax=Macrobrachium nipponense TaxID=159736 RepID=UPI0030C810AD